MKPFKFFSDNNDEDDGLLFGYDDDNMASWTWWHQHVSSTEIPIREITVECNGIYEFLRLFHPQMIVLVINILGPNGIIHDGLTEHPEGWGFDITSDPIIITYIQYLPENYESL